MKKSCLVCSFLTLLLSLPGYANCDKKNFSDRLDAKQLWQDITTLAGDGMQGRKTATSGARLARNYISSRYQQIGLREFPRPAGQVGAAYLRNFTVPIGWSKVTGSNVMGWLEGIRYTQRFIVITAHYDHLGSNGNSIYNGADDNASGVAAMLGIARYIAEHPSQYSIIFVATDAEEKGLYGAKGFLADPPVPLAAIILNLNLDMLAQGGRQGKLYVTPARGQIMWQTTLDNVIERVGSCLIKGHRSSLRNRIEHKNINWHNSSDHAVFASKNIPYLFLGVSDHPLYHTENDITGKINQGFFKYASQTALTLLLAFDQLAPGSTVNHQATPSSLSRSAK